MKKPRMPVVTRGARCACTGYTLAVVEPPAIVASLAIVHDFVQLLLLSTRSRCRSRDDGTPDAVAPVAAAVASSVRHSKERTAGLVIAFLAVCAGGSQFLLRWHRYLLHFFSITESSSGGLFLTLSALVSCASCLPLTAPIVVCLHVHVERSARRQVARAVAVNRG